MPEALASPWGKNNISNHQASGVEGRPESGLQQPLGCLPQLPTLPGSQENKGFPLSLHQEKGDLSHTPGPCGGCVTGQGIEWGQQKRTGDAVFGNI